MLRLLTPVLFPSVLLFASCSGDGQKENATAPAENTPPPAAASKPLVVPQLNADSAYAFVKAQVDFGPRIPGTKAHAACAVWMEEKLLTFPM